MSRLKFILASLVLFISGSAHAGDLGWAGAASGAGQAMSQSLFMLQNAMQQAALEEQREKAQLERECRQFEAQGIAVAQCPRTQVRYGRPRAEVQGTDAETLRQQRETAERERAQQATVQGLKITLEGLNQQRERLNATSDSPQRRQAVWEYIQQACEFQRHLSAYYQRYGIPEPAEQQAIRQRFENQRAEILREQATRKTQAEQEAEANRLNIRKQELDHEYQHQPSYQSRLAEYQQLMIEKRWLDQQKEMLEKEVDSPAHRQAITEYNRQVLEYSTRLTAFNQRKGLVQDMAQQKSVQQVIEEERIRK